MYNPGSYFPLWVGAYWIYERNSGQIDSVRCDGEAVAYDRGLASDTAFSLEMYEKPFGGSYSPSVKTGVYEGYAKLKAFKCLSDQDQGFFDENLMPMNFFATQVCSHQGTDAWLVICMVRDTTLAGYSDVRVFREITSTQFDSLDYDTQNGHMHLTTMMLKANASYTDNSYSRGVGLIRKEVYTDGNYSSTANLIRYRIQ